MYDEEEGKLKVIIAAARADVLRPYLDALREKKIYPARITVTAAGFATLCGVLDNNTDALCISISETGYEGCYLTRGTLSSTLYGSFPSRNRESNLGQVTVEIARIIDRLKNKDITPAIFLFPVDGGYNYAIPQQIAGVPVQIFTEDDLRTKLKTSAEDIVAPPLGGLLEGIRPGAKGFNLLTKGTREIRKAPLVITILLLSIIVAMAIPLSGCASSNSEEQACDNRRSYRIAQG